MVTHRTGPTTQYALHSDKGCGHRSEGSSRAEAGAPRSGGVGSAVILDTTTPPDDHTDVARSFWAHIQEPRSRRIWSRCKLGFHLPGDYYFTTMTTSPEARKPITLSAKHLRRWFRRHHPKYEYLQVLTNEGNGTAHIVQRLPRKSPKIDVNALREYWKATNQTAIFRIEPVRTKRDKLMQYLAEQTVKGMSREMAYQPMILNWSRSKNWIPAHFLGPWKRYWNSPDLTIEQKDVHTREWIREYARNM